jgi:hypothetical protein
MSTQVRERLRLDLKSFTAPRFNRLRPTEMAAVGLALGLVLLVIMYYFVSLAPALDRLATVEKENAYQIQVIGQTPPPQSGPSQKQQILEAKNSLDNFEGHYLKAMAQGRIDLINEINQLAKADNLHLGSGIEMHALHKTGSAADTETQNAKKKKDTETLDIFPRVQFHFVVRGEYKDLRKFLRDLESSKQYVVFDSVSLSSSEQKQGRGSRVAQVATPSGLSLTVSMNAYFRP